MKILQIIRRYGAPVFLSLLSASYIAQAQIVNPSQPATGVPLAGTGITVSGQTVSVNYGVANSPFTGNMTVGGTFGVTGATSLGALSASGAISGAGFTAFMASPPAIGSTAANSGAFTTLTNSSTFTSSGAAILNGAVSGTGIANYISNASIVQSVATVAALRSINCVPGLLYASQGYASIGDGAGERYVCNGADTTTPDNGGSVIAAANSYRLYVQNPYPVSTKVFGAKVDGSTDDTTAISNAIATGLPVFFPAGTSLTTASIAGFHAARKTGPGYISRGGNSFAITPLPSDTNKLFVSTTGSDTSDGLSSSQPQLTIQASINNLLYYGPTLNGNWQINLAAGTYTNGASFPQGLQSKALIVLQGPSSTLPFVPTAIISGASSPTTNYGIYLNGGNNVEVLNVYFQNWQNAGNDYCVAGEQFSELWVNNVYATNCDVAVKLQQGRLYVTGGIFNGGITGIESISGTTHTIGYGETGSGAVNIATTAVSGNGTTATATIAAQSSAPTVGSTVVIRGVTPSGFNGVYTITASTTTTISYLNATSGTATVQGVLGYNFGATGVGPLVTNYTQQGILLQENSTGHVDYTDMDNDAVGLDIVASSRANMNYSNVTNNATIGIRGRAGSNYLNNGIQFYGNAVNAPMYTSSEEIGTEGSYTSELRQPVDLTFVSNTGPLSSTVEKTYSTAIPANIFTSSVGKIVVHVAGEITGTAGTKNMVVNAAGSPLCGFTTLAATQGSYAMDCVVYAQSATSQSYTSSLMVDSAYPQLSSGSRSINMATGSAIPITITNALTAADTMTIRSVEIRQSGF